MNFNDALTHAVVSKQFSFIIDFKYYSNSNRHSYLTMESKEMVTKGAGTTVLEGEEGNEAKIATQLFIGTWNVTGRWSARTIVENAMFQFVRQKVVHKLRHDCKWCGKGVLWSIVSTKNALFSWIERRELFRETAATLAKNNFFMAEGLEKEADSVIEMDEEDFQTYLLSLKDQYWDMQIRMLLAHGNRLVRCVAEEGWGRKRLQSSDGMLKWHNNSCAIDAIVSTIPFMVSTILELNVLGKDSRNYMKNSPLTALLTIIHYVEKSKTEKDHLLLSNYARETILQLSSMCLQGSKEGETILHWEPVTAQGFLNIQDVIDVVLMPMLNPFRIKAKGEVENSYEKMGVNVKCKQWMVAKDEANVISRTELLSSLLSIIRRKEKCEQVQIGVHIFTFPNENVYTEVTESVSTWLGSSQWTYCDDDIHAKLVAAVGYKDGEESHFVGYVFNEDVLGKEKKQKRTTGKPIELKREIYISDGMDKGGRFTKVKYSKSKSASTSKRCHEMNFEASNKMGNNPAGRNTKNNKESLSIEVPMFKIHGSGLRIIIICGRSGSE